MNVSIVWNIMEMRRVREGHLKIRMQRAYRSVNQLLSLEFALRPELVRLTDSVVGSKVASKVIGSLD